MTNDATIKLGYDGKKVEAGFSALQNRAKSSAASVAKTFSHLGNRVSTSLRVIGGVGVGVGIRAFKETLNDLDDLADLSTKLNETPETIQRVGVAAKLSGSSVETLADAMLKLERGLGAVENTKAREALARYGFTAEEILALPLDQKLIALASAFQKARDEGHGLADIQVLMGKQSADLIPLLAMTGDELRGMFAGVDVLSNQAVDDMARLNDQVDLVAENWSTKMKKMAVGAQFLAEETTALAKDLWSGTSEASDALTESRVQREAEGLKRRAQQERARAQQERARAQIAAKIGGKDETKDATKEATEQRVGGALVNLEDRASSARREDGGEHARKRIKGYSAAQYTTNPLIDHRGFNEFFSPNRTQLGFKSRKSFGDQSFAEFFHPEVFNAGQPKRGAAVSKGAEIKVSGASRVSLAEGKTIQATLDGIREELTRITAY